MIDAIMSTLSTIVENFGNVLGKVFNGITSIFYTAGASDGQGQLTFLGIILLISVGASLVYWGFKLITSLISRVGGKKQIYKEG